MHSWVLLMIGITAGCSRFLPDSSPPTPALPASSPTVIASLFEYFPTVNYRRSNELVWQPVSPQQDFFRYDSVQTQGSASAKIRFKNGSELDLSSNTLVIINPTSKDEVDRAIIRGGHLRGQTHRELLLLTSGALLRVQAKKNGMPARIVVNIKEGKKLTVLMKEGKGTLIETSPKGKVRAIELGETIVISAPVLPLDFGTLNTRSDWPVEDPLLAAIDSKPTKPRSVPEIKKIELKLDSTLKQATINEAQTAVSGQLIGSGARVLINGIQVSPDEGHQRFNHVISLQMGANPVVIQVIHPDGHSTYERRIFIREK